MIRRNKEKERKRRRKRRRCHDQGKGGEEKKRRKKREWEKIGKGEGLGTSSPYVVLRHSYGPNTCEMHRQHCDTHPPSERCGAEHACKVPHVDTVPFLELVARPNKAVNGRT